MSVISGIFNALNSLLPKTAAAPAPSDVPAPIASPVPTAIASNLVVNTAVLREIAPEDPVNSRRIIDVIGPVMMATLTKFEINTRLRAAHFIAQIAHESNGFRTTVEYASGNAYEGRKDLGNNNPGDGVRYKGRGLIQLTGKDNYRTYGQRIGVDLVTNPELAADPVVSLTLAGQYWSYNGLNVFADRDDLETVTRRINGGLNGFDSRRAYLGRAKTSLLRAAGGA